jgi:V-type H+-transporting ATPase subunit E
MADDDRQIHAMIEFIERDAHEKAREYDDEAQSVYDSEKASLVESQKKKVAQQAEKEKKKIDVDDRVGKARVSKAQRMKLLDERVAIVDNLKEQTQQQVQQLVNNATKYKQLLADLLRQSAVAIEADANVQCRKSDEAVVKGLLPAAEQAVHQKTGLVVKLSIGKEPLEDAAWGGVILTSTDGRIKCNNTLKSRTEHCFAEQLPTVRHFLFNDNAKF